MLTLFSTLFHVFAMMSGVAALLARDPHKGGCDAVCGAQGRKLRGNLDRRSLQLCQAIHHPASTTARAAMSNVCDAKLSCAGTRAWRWQVLP